MAVVFISPKQRQKTFFMGITIAFALLVVAVALIVFLSQPSSNAAQVAFNKPKIVIDFKNLDSEQFQNLEPFSQMNIQYSYTASDKTGKTVEGLVSATSLEEATNILQSRDLTIITIEEVQPGRDNPFTPYYQVPAPKTVKTTNK